MVQFFKHLLYFITQIGKTLANKLIDLFNNGLDSTKLHLLGHSMGAHIGGLVARKIYEKSKKAFKIKRVSGLDPAFPPFYPPFRTLPLFFYKPLNKNDADLVIILSILQDPVF